MNLKGKKTKITLAQVAKMSMTSEWMYLTSRYNIVLKDYIMNQMYQKLDLEVRYIPVKFHRLFQLKKNIF